jgi:hypothetical protein
MTRLKALGYHKVKHPIKIRAALVGLEAFSRPFKIDEFTSEKL